MFIEARATTLCNVPEMSVGNQPIDDGNYLFTEEEIVAHLMKLYSEKVEELRQKELEEAERLKAEKAAERERRKAERAATRKTKL